MIKIKNTEGFIDNFDVGIYRNEGAVYISSNCDVVLV